MNKMVGADCGENNNTFVVLKTQCGRNNLLKLVTSNQLAALVAAIEPDGYSNVSIFKWANGSLADICNFNDYSDIKRKKEIIFNQWRVEL